MKITPLEIRQKQFERTLRGFDKDEVSAFLLTLSQEWERMQDNEKEMRIKLDLTEKEIVKLREVESSLYKTLKTAEETGSNMIDQAHKAAELHLRETQMKAEGLLNEVKAKAKDTAEQAEDTARQMLDEMEERLKIMVQQYKGLEAQRDNLLSDLKRVAGETIDRVERSQNAPKEFDADRHFAAAKREAKKLLYPNADFEPTFKHSLIPAPVLIETTQASVVEERQIQKSFFDDIQ
jgi:cell division initiation protein